MNAEMLFPQVAFKKLRDALNDTNITDLVSESGLINFANAMLVYSKLPTHISSNVVETALIEATGGSGLPGGGKVDVKDEGKGIVYQIKTMRKLTPSVIWGRIPLRDKLDMIPASKVNYVVRKVVAQSLLEKLLGDFKKVIELHGRFVYLQAIRDGDQMYCVLAEFDLDKLTELLSGEDIYWAWTPQTSNTDRYPSLSGFVAAKKLFSWNGLSGNHFNIVDINYFIDRTCKSINGVKFPLSSTPFTTTELTSLL